MPRNDMISLFQSTSLQRHSKVDRWWRNLCDGWWRRMRAFLASFVVQLKWTCVSNRKFGPPCGSTLNLYHHVPTIYGLYRSHGRRFRKQTASYSSKGTHMFFLNADFIEVIGCLVSPQYLGTYLKKNMVYFLSGSSSPWNHNLWNVFFTLFIYTFFQTAFLSTSKKQVFLKTEFYVHPSNK